MNKLLVTVASILMFMTIGNAQVLNNVACKKLGETPIEKKANLSYEESNNKYGNEFVKFCDCFYDEAFKTQTSESMLRILIYIATIQGDEGSNNFQKLASLYKLEMNKPKNAKMYNAIVAVIDKPIDKQNYEQHLLPIANAMGLIDNELMMAKQMVSSRINQQPVNSTYENLLVDIIQNFSSK